MENSRHWVSDVASIWYVAGSCALAHALVTLKHGFYVRKFRIYFTNKQMF